MKQLHHSIVVMLLVTWQTAENCPQGQFKNQDGLCCRFCHDGFYINKNCSKTEVGFGSTGCKLCSKCPDGWNTVAQCTKFSNAVCEKVTPTLMPSVTAYSIANTDANFTINSTENFTNPTAKAHIPPHSSADLHTVLYITLPLVLFLIVGIFACKKCVIKRYAQTKQSPYKLQQL